MKNRKIIINLLHKSTLLILLLISSNLFASQEKPPLAKMSFINVKCSINYPMMNFLSSNLYKKAITTSFKKVISLKNNKLTNADIVISSEEITNTYLPKQSRLLLHLSQPIYLIVNKTNNIKNISKEQLGKIILGKTKYWSELSTKKDILPELRIHLYAPDKKSYLMTNFFASFENKDIKKFNRFNFLNDNDEVAKISVFDPNSLSLTNDIVADKLKFISFDKQNPFIIEDNKIAVNVKYSLRLHYYFYSIKNKNDKKIAEFLKLFDNKKNLELLNSKMNYYKIDEIKKLKLNKKTDK